VLLAFESQYKCPECNRDIKRTYLDLNKNEKCIEKLNKPEHVYRIRCKGNGVYEGEIINGNINGKGTYYMADGSRYEGDWLDGKRHGKGTYFDRKTGSVYDGDWKNDKMHGYGMIYFDRDHEPRVSKFDGEFVKNKINGYGKFFYHDGSQLLANWRMGKLTGGPVVFNFHFGGKYEGSLSKDGTFLKGKFTCKNGDIYNGHFKNNLPNGHGVYYFCSDSKLKDSRYEGNFVDGNFNGKGTLFYSNGVKYTCKWIDNKSSSNGQFYFNNKKINRKDVCKNNNNNNNNNNNYDLSKSRFSVQSYSYSITTLFEYESLL
jgi:hypothetical protein